MTIHDNPQVLERLASRGRPAQLAMRMEVQECFFHCAKAFKRSRLWHALQALDRHQPEGNP
jgi:predicted pyridoxine 5'-phosphate oxidase superfamily flavin-nucleotide-binding protein